MYYLDKRTSGVGGKTLFICDTPYQLLNILNYVCHLGELGGEELHICICDRDFSREQIKSVNELGLFNRVFVYQTDLVSPKEGKDFFYRLNRFCFPRKYIASLITDRDFNCKAYNRLFCAFPIPLAVAITAVNPDLELRLFDDGIGSYINGIPSPDSKKRKLLYKLRGKTSPWSRVRYIYANNVDHFPRDTAAQLVPLMPMCSSNQVFQASLETVFGYNNCSLYDQCKVVYLTQPLETIFENCERLKDIENGLLETLTESGISFVVRKHPKHRDCSFGDVREDENNDLWELICAKQITDEHMLISCYSTAQFSPKMLFGKEPWLIFVHRLYSDFFDEDKLLEMDKMIGKLKSCYKDKHKILAIQSVNELRDTLINIC